MSGTQYREDPYVECPYYRKESPVEIKCVGICGEHTTNTFSNKKSKQLHKDDFCCGFYFNCSLYIALETDGK